MTVLIADDNFQMRQLLKSLLQDLAAEIYECADGSAALALYRKHRPNWVLLDIEMQPMDGLTASQLLHESFPSARILIVTNYDDDDLREQARRAGACGYLLKENLLGVRQLLRAS
jgi:CheY-like chemotaxis protein